MSQELHPLTEKVFNASPHQIDFIIRSYLKERVEEYEREWGCDVGYSLAALRNTFSLTHSKPKRKALKAQAIAKKYYGGLYLTETLDTEEDHKRHIASIGHTLIKFPAGEQIEEVEDE